MGVVGFRKGSHVVTFVPGLKGERFTRRDSPLGRGNHKCLSEVMGTCIWAQGTRIVPGNRNAEGFGKSGATGEREREIGFVGLGDLLKVVRIMLVICNGKGEGQVKSLGF